MSLLFYGHPCHATALSGVPHLKEVPRSVVPNENSAQPLPGPSPLVPVPTGPAGLPLGAAAEYVEASLNPPLSPGGQAALLSMFYSLLHCTPLAPAAGPEPHCKAKALS